MTDRRTDDPGKNNMSPTTKGECHKNEILARMTVLIVVLNKIRTEFFKVFHKNSFFLSFIRICSNMDSKGLATLMD